MDTRSAVDGGLERLRAHGLVAFPTETVWGLGGLAMSREAVARVRTWKGRGAEAPISILVPSAESLSRYGFSVSSVAEALIQAFWPGPLTVVLPSQGAFAPGIARADGAVGVRCSTHPLAAGLARELEDMDLGPLTATSLNRTGEEPAATRLDAERLCGGAHDAPLLIFADGLDATGEAPSTVVDCASDLPRILREGGLAAEEVEPYLAS